MRGLGQWGTADTVRWDVDCVAAGEEVIHRICGDCGEGEDLNLVSASDGCDLE